MPDIIGKRFDRTTIEIDTREVNVEQRTVDAALSSETPVPRWGYKEILRHTKDAIDLSRASNGLPLLFAHNSDQPIGIVENIRLNKDKRLRGTLRFSNNPKASEVWGDVRDGFLKNLSIGYQVSDYTENEIGDEVTVTGWSLLEASVVSVPADASVGVNRSINPQEDGIMPETPENGGQGAAPTDPTTNIDHDMLRMARKRLQTQGEADGIKKERKRVSEIRDLFAPHIGRDAAFEDLMNLCIDKGLTRANALEELATLLGDQSVAQPLGPVQDQDSGYAQQPPQTYRSQIAPQFFRNNGGQPVGQPVDMNRVSGQPAGREPFIQQGMDQQDKYNRIVEMALNLRVGNLKDAEQIREVRESEYGSMLVSEMARDFLMRNRISSGGMSREKLIGEAMTRGPSITHSTSDFANILANVSNKSMLLGYEEQPETWQMIAATRSVPDFKTNSFVGLSSFGSLPQVYENGEYTYGTMSDRKETAQLATFGRLFSISRQALANDDLNALGQLPRAFGRAASRTVGDKVYYVLTSNPTLNQDSTSLFDVSTHANYVSSSGDAPSVTTLDAARVAMATQKDQSDAATALNIRLSRLIVPVALETTANILRTSEKDPAEGATTSFNAPNPMRNTFEVVADARLDAASTTAWYASADPNMTDTVAACFLNGQSEPYMEMQNGWSVDGVSYKVRIDCVAVALDFRGIYKNVGA